MDNALLPFERLIVAADFKPIYPNGREWVRGKVLSLADSLRRAEVCIKVHSALRACGYDLISEIHSRNLRVFADLKLFDIDSTLAVDGVLLKETKPEFVTVACTAGIKAMQVLKMELPDTEVLGVTVLTSFTEADALAMFVCSTEGSIMRLSKFAVEAHLDGLISSPVEVSVLRARFGLLMSLNAPAIRPSWLTVKGDSQNLNRVMTPAEAIRAGADRIIVGRPIIEAEDPYSATMRIIEEIHSVTK